MKAKALATLAMAVLMSAGAGTAAAAVLRVNQSGLWGAEPAATTVQSAIDAAVAGDEVWVAAGTYLENCTLKYGVSLFGGFAGDEASRSERDWNAHRTILDGGGAPGSVIYAPTSVSATIDGFTIQNGTGTKYSWLRSVEGGGILGLQYSNLTIANNVFRNNTAVYGGGLSIKEDSTVTIYNNIFYGNSALDGGGIALTNSHGTVANNTVVGNAAAGSGGGILSFNSGADVVNNNFTGNTADGGYGGGVYILHNSPPFPPPYFGNNNFFGNTIPDYYGATGGTNDLSVDPQYVDAANADYRLLPASACIDAGDSSYIAPLTDIDSEGDPRVMYAAADIGADEWVDRVAPVVLSTSPAAGSINIGLTARVLVTYDEQIQAGPAFDQIRITYIKTSKKGSTVVTVPTVKSISGNVLTITHSSAFPASTLLTVTLPAQAVTDGTGNPSAPYSFKFTTGRR